MISRVRYLLIGALLPVIAGCATNRPTHNLEISQLGRFEYREPKPGMSGVVIGAPHGGTVPATVALADLISERTGAGFVAAYGFRSKQISVEQPAARSYPYRTITDGPFQRRSVFVEFKDILRRVTQGSLDLYIGIRHRPPAEGFDRVQVIASGFTFEEAAVIKQSFVAERDRVIGSSAIEKLSISIDPLEAIGWQAAGLLHHGVLMLAERGLSVRVPEKFLSPEYIRVYGEIISVWVKNIENLVNQGSRSLQQVEVKVMDLGRIDLIPSRKGIAGVVIGAPHGSYDEYTAEIAKQLSFRTSLAAVITRGFTPTEAGGWRINVNRPSEMNYLTPDIEVNSSRAQKIFDAFKQSVLKAAGGDLRLYFDVHQYGADNTIQIATVGVNSQQAFAIKRVYNSARDSLLKEYASVDRVELLIEPLDNIEIGAWAAKYSGILSVARKSLHIELPLNSALRTQTSRNLYTKLLSEVIAQALRDLAN